MKTLLMSLIVIAGLNSVSALASGNGERALIAVMKVKPGTESQFLKAAENVIVESRRESGNIRYQLHESATNPEVFAFYELFESENDLQYHKNAPHVKAFLAETKPITTLFTLEEYIPVGDLQ